VIASGYALFMKRYTFFLPNTNEVPAILLQKSATGGSSSQRAVIEIISSQDTE
jgi:hypothetical protein